MMNKLALLVICALAIVAKASDCESPSNCEDFECYETNCVASSCTYTAVDSTMSGTLNEHCTVTNCMWDGDELTCSQDLLTPQQATRRCPDRPGAITSCPVVPANVKMNGIDLDAETIATCAMEDGDGVTLEYCNPLFSDFEPGTVMDVPCVCTYETPCSTNDDCDDNLFEGFCTKAVCSNGECVPKSRSDECCEDVQDCLSITAINAYFSPEDVAVFSLLGSENAECYGHTCRYNNVPELNCRENPADNCGPRPSPCGHWECAYCVAGDGSNFYWYGSSYDSDLDTNVCPDQYSLESWGGVCNWNTSGCECDGLGADPSDPFGVSMEQCDDGNPCTVDKCIDGSCINREVEFDDCCVFDSDCNDQNPCTENVCMNNKCHFIDRPNCCIIDNDCNDGVDCTTDVCVGKGNQTGGTCMNIDECEPVVEGTACSEDSECNDRNKCTFDTCDGGFCRNTRKENCCFTKRDCDDGNPCTDDMCVKRDNGIENTVMTECVHEPIEDCCLSDSECSVSAPCQYGFCDTNSLTCGIVGLYDTPACRDHCGNGLVEPQYGEECEPSDGECCTKHCQLKRSIHTCGAKPEQNGCWLLPRCSGDSAVCPDNAQPRRNGVTCGDEADETVCQDGECVPQV